MEAVYTHCCGLDVHKKTVVACLLTAESNEPRRKEIRTFSTMTADLLALGDWLKAAGCTVVAMESTGVFWKPIYNLLEGQFELRARQCPTYQGGPGAQDRCARCGMDRRSLATRVAQGQRDPLARATRVARAHPLPHQPGRGTGTPGQSAPKGVGRYQPQEGLGGDGSDGQIRSRDAGGPAGWGNRPPGVGRPGPGPHA